MSNLFESITPRNRYNFHWFLGQSDGDDDDDDKSPVHVQPFRFVVCRSIDRSLWMMSQSHIRRRRGRNFMHTSQCQTDQTAAGSQCC